jgi:hypothetical protein
MDIALCLFNGIARLHPLGMRIIPVDELKKK